MSRSRTAVLPMLALLAVLGGGAPARAQSADSAAPPATAEQAVAAARDVYGPPPPRPACGSRGDGGEIVVCAPDRGEDQRVESTAESNPNSREALFDGIPRAPQLDKGSCKGQAGCMAVGSVPPPVYYFDIKGLPEPPAGSDADRIAKGEQKAE